MDENLNKSPLDNEKRRYLDYAWSHAHLGMTNDAVSDCKKLIETDPDDPTSYIELGYYYEKNGELDNAKEYYSETMKRFPQYGGSYTNMGHYFHVHKRRLDIAMVLYGKALELNPEERWAWNNIGTILQAKGKWQEALKYYECAYNFREGDKEKDYAILYNLAWAYYKCKKYDNATIVYKEAISLYPDEASLYRDFACVQYKCGMFKDYCALLEKALSICPDSRYYKRLYNVVRNGLEKSI